MGGEERREECGCEVAIQLCGRRGEERGKGGGGGGGGGGEEGGEGGVGVGGWVGREGEGSEQYNLRALTFM